MVTLAGGRILYLAGDNEAGYSNVVYEYVEGGDWIEIGAVSAAGGGKTDFMALALTQDEFCGS